MIVTGASSGIGVETARALARSGAEVTLAVRNVEAGDAVAARITSDTDNKQVFVTPLELSDRDSIATLVETWQGPLHALINNAGVMGLPERQLTSEGWEAHFATNHLGHLALAFQLHDALAAAGNARIVAVSSDAHAHARTPIDFDDLFFERCQYHGGKAYAQSKVANILFAVEATKRWGPDGIMANAVHPGGIKTRLQRHNEGVELPESTKKTLESWPWRTAEQGAATTVLLAASPLLDGVGGRYFENCNEAVLCDPENPTGERDAPGVAPYAIDPEAAARLWDVSVDMLRSAGWLE